MADHDKTMDMQLKLLKNTKIQVFVDEVLPDILVVTYEFGVKIFKGVLLDSCKRNLPYGVQTLHPAFTTKTNNADDDLLFSVNQRFTYTDPKSRNKNVRIPSRFKNNRMTVRLRPRQVLCSKCKAVCNENSESVSRKRKSSESVPAPQNVKRSANAPMTRSAYNIEHQNRTSNSNNNNKSKGSKSIQTLIPKLHRLQSQNTLSAISGGCRTEKEETNISTAVNSTSKPDTTDGAEENQENKLLSPHSMQHSDNSNDSLQSLEVNETKISNNTQPLAKSIKRSLRKKRSVGSMEDLWDESVFEENRHPSENGSALNEQHQNTMAVINTKTIKISFGSQGEGTVLKIPAQIENLHHISDDSEENNSKIESRDLGKTLDNKAARKAFKKAKKKARHKVLLCNSPSYISGMSPRYTIGGSSPRYMLGGNSPRYVTSSTSDYMPKRHKHKMKRKKKHREDKDKDRKHRDEEVSQSQSDAPYHYQNKESTITQKLSINLKRLNNTLYTSCQSASEKGDGNSSSSDEHSEQVPDFPSSNPPLILRMNSQTVTSALGADGVRLAVGDVVWGKIHGFPWWPGKVLTITASSQQVPQAHVAWYGSSTSSLIQCDQLSPYLENFKIRYNKKKRGPYKEAIRQATTEAKENAENKMRRDATIVTSPTHSIITVPPPALASPREIDVMS
ncbi:PWWP domain-containing protein 2A-like [Agrilus planipennis]|uniref:PWWP domain-containing protein 2A-like n=1 Tax=Agrilus planipennis TaxID=224129 RepID=A0A1W4X7K7_AGRPL|nr:PWWP domain-containing protein 2A-like [Agrilus planipennis]